VYEALETLAAWNLVEPRDGRWVLVPGTRLTLLAEQFGCADTVRALVKRHRDERARYRRGCSELLTSTRSRSSIRRMGTCGPPPDPPPEDGETLLQLLERELGAHPIPAG